MENRENMPLIEEELESSAFSQKYKIRDMFELCLQPERKEDLDNILLNFRETIKSIQESDHFSTIDYVKIYILDYVYKHDTAPFCSVLRALYLYQILDQLVLKGEDRNIIGDCNTGCLLKMLRKFANEYTYSKGEEMADDAALSAILAGNIGLALYLVKYGLIDFPSEVNDKYKNMFEVLVSMFNTSFKLVTVNDQAGDTETSLQLSELLSQVKESEINIRRSILAFCILTIASEYRMYNNIEVHLGNHKFYTEHKKHLCLRSLVCINLYIQSTTELRITFKDIENFTEIFLNPFVTAEVGNSLVETCKKLLDESHNYYDPRPLKDLARMKIRSSLKKTMSLPAQVNELKIPSALKDFLNFKSKGIWDLLLINHIHISLDQNLNRHTPQMEQEGIENEIVRELFNRYQQAIEGENVYEMGLNVLEIGLNVRELGGNVHKLGDRNAHENED